MEYIHGVFDDSADMTKTYTFSNCSGKLPVEINGRYFRAILKHTETISNLDEVHISYNAGGTAGYGLLTYIRYSPNFGRRYALENNKPSVDSAKNMGTYEIKEIYGDIYFKRKQLADGIPAKYFSSYTSSGGIHLQRVMSFNNRNSTNSVQSMFYRQTYLRYFDMGLLMSEPGRFTDATSVRATFRATNGITVNMKESDVRNITVFATTSAYAFIPNSADSVVLYSDYSKISPLLTYYPNITLSTYAILVNTSTTNYSFGVFDADGNEVDVTSDDWGVARLTDKDLGTVADFGGSMWGLFDDYGKTQLTRIDMSTVDTSSITNFREMFTGCVSLQEIDLSGDFNTLNATSYAYMFKNVPSTCVVYYNPATMKQAIINANTNLIWISKPNKETYTIIRDIE